MERTKKHGQLMYDRMKSDQTFASDHKLYPDLFPEDVTGPRTATYRCFHLKKPSGHSKQRFSSTEIHWKCFLLNVFPLCFFDNLGCFHHNFFKTLDILDELPVPSFPTSQG